MVDGYRMTLADYEALRSASRDPHDVLGGEWMAGAVRRTEAERHERLVSGLAAVFGAAQADPRFALVAA